MTVLWGHEAEHGAAGQNGRLRKSALKETGPELRRELGEALAQTSGKNLGEESGLL